MALVLIGTARQALVEQKRNHVGPAPRMLQLSSLLSPTLIFDLFRALSTTQPARVRPSSRSAFELPAQSH